MYRFDVGGFTIEYPNASLRLDEPQRFDEVFEVDPLAVTLPLGDRRGLLDRNPSLEVASRSVRSEMSIPHGSGHRAPGRWIVKGRRRRDDDFDGHRADVSAFGRIERGTVCHRYHRRRVTPCPGREGGAWLRSSCWGSCSSVNSCSP